MRIGLTFNLKPAGATGDRFEEFDSEETIVALERAIRSSGHEPVRLGWGEEMLDALQRERVDGVFNLAEGIGGRGRESQVPAVLEMLGIPCTASSALSIGLTLDKALAKRVAQANGIATAPFRVAGRGSQVAGGDSCHPERSEGSVWVGGAQLEPPSSRHPPTPIPRYARNDTLRFPLFCKPCNEGSSMGITAKSFCSDEAELKQTVEQLTKYGPVLIEEFLSGDEYTVGIVDDQPIGVMQVLPRNSSNQQSVIGNQQSGEPFIYSIDVKRDYLNRVEYRTFRDAELEAVAMDVWRAFNLRDVARVDIRRDRDGVPNFVEVNPLPGMNPVTSDLIILATGLGWKYDDLIGRVLASAIRRWAA